MQRFTTKPGIIISRIVLVLLFMALSVSADTQQHRKDKEKKRPSDFPAVIWHDPGKISALNLIYGAGGADYAPDPKGKFTFIDEDKKGTSPKFNVKDANGVTWRVKLGDEPQSETAATRLLWAAGYFVDQDYYLPELKVEGLRKLRRGQEYISPGGVVHGARLKRKDKHIQKIGNWDWFKNPFVGTKEFNGLRVMMALMNNWDLKKSNNAIYAVDSQQQYTVSDLGASFGRTGNTMKRSKSDELGYQKSAFIKRVTPSEIDFELHSRPLVFVAVDIPKYRERTKMELIVKHIPREHAKWIGQLLAKLSEQQIRDCFRTAGYSQEEIKSYTNAVLDRIIALNAL